MPIFHARRLNARQSLRLLAGLSAYYSLNKVGGVLSLSDLTGQGGTLTNINAVPASGTGLTTANCAVFTSASSQALSVASSINNTIGDGQSFSIASYVKVASHAAQCTIASKTATGGTRFEYALYLTTTPTLAWQLTDSAGNVTTKQSPQGYDFSGNIWQLCVGIYDAAHKRMGVSLNNNNITYANIPSVEPTSALAMFIGAGLGGTLNYFNGSMNNLGIWNRALTQADITALWNSGLGVDYTNF